MIKPNPKYAQAQIALEQCPHCGISRPTMALLAQKTTSAYNGQHTRVWSMYRCSTCGGVTLTAGVHANPTTNSAITQMWPEPKLVSGTIPKRAQTYMTQALASRHAPAGAIMLTASAIDSMLKDKGYREGSLNARIDLAAHDHLITREMATWAHEIRLDANDQRHADEKAALPTPADSDKAFEFADALAQFLYVLPALVKRGRKPVETKA